MRTAKETKAERLTRATAILAMTTLATTTCAGLLLLVPDARAEIVTVAYEAEAVTVVDEPFGVEVPRLTIVTGYFTFDTSTPDADPDDESFGEYPHARNSAFAADFLETEIRGSDTAHYQVQVSGNDTFRIWDGPRVVGNEGGIMSIDGTPDEDIELFLAVMEEDVFPDDDLVNPFPSYTFGFLGTPHTFALEDDQGTMLLQFESVQTVVCGDPNGSGTSTAADALLSLKTAVGTAECLRCACDADGNGIVASSDALKILRFAVAGSPPLTCSHCL
jgi:hypothetical protein